MAGIVAAELGPAGVRCVDLEPGFVATERATSDPRLAWVAERGKSPAVVGAVAAWLLASPTARSPTAARSASTRWRATSASGTRREPVDDAADDGAARPRRVRRAWCRGIDEGAWTSLAVPERITYPSHDVTVQLAAAAALTERVRLWTTIVILPAHDAVAVAKQMASVDVLSDGRLTVGVGVGGREHDYRAIGAPFDPSLAAHGRAGRDHAAHLGRRAAVRGRRSGRSAAGASPVGRRSSQA